MKISKPLLIATGVLVIFLALRLPGLDRPYHQDEYKWALYVEGKVFAPGSVPHPPLSEFIYVYLGGLVGLNNFRTIPLLFSVGSLLLLYLVVKRRYGNSAALWSLLIYCLSFYSVLASLQVDTDGAILPFFFLLSVLFYDSWISSEHRHKWLWFGILCLALLAGIMVKMSFVLAIGAILIDYIFENRSKLSKRNIIVASGVFGGFAGLVVLSLWVSQYIFNGFNLYYGFSYWDSFARGFFERNYLQILIQLIKALLYLSPVLVLAGVLSLVNKFRHQFRLFHIFIGLSLIFYLVIFDFSKGALDRYFTLMIVPLCIMTGYLTSQLLEYQGGRFCKKIILPGLITGIGIFFFQYLYHAVPPLYPKTEWVDRILSLKWDFLFPFFGGSGPLGFYMSWLFIGCEWILSGVLFVGLIFLPNIKREAWIIILVSSLVYNMAFTEEYIWGRINGSASSLVGESVKFIKETSNIDKVIVYNDNGGYDVQGTGKYVQRLYAAPKFEAGYDKVLETFSGHYLVIDIPRLSSDNKYNLFWSKCPIVFQKHDDSISATLYDCRMPALLP